MPKNSDLYIYDQKPETKDFCDVCNLAVPLARRVVEFNINDTHEVLHPECQKKWLVNETKKVLIMIAETIRGVCAKTAQFCKKIKRRLRRKNRLEELVDIFKNMVTWIREGTEYFRQAATHTLNKLYRQINYLADKLNLGDEAISFPLPLPR